MTRRACPSCFDDYCEPGQTLCPDCSAARSRTTPKKPQPHEAGNTVLPALPASLAGMSLSDFGVTE